MAFVTARRARVRVPSGERSKRVDHGRRWGLHGEARDGARADDSRGRARRQPRIPQARWRSLRARQLQPPQGLCCVVPAAASRAGLSDRLAGEADSLVIHFQLVGKVPGRLPALVRILRKALFNQPPE